jgi:predicted esterase
VLHLRTVVLTAGLLALAQELPRGKLIEKATCYEDRQQSYALYLPSSYDSGRSWPILYCFDPAARGRVPVERFQEAAEHYGWIVVGSNNSRNGPFEVNLNAMDAMWRDTHARFAIDARRIYAAGFSGGARMACRMGLAGGLVAGVIASGGGFPEPDLPKSIPFVFFGTAGTEDFNGSELKELDRELHTLGARHRVVVVAGGHDWPAPALARDAIEWMELEAMKAGRRAKDDTLVEALFRKAVARAEAAEAAGRVPEAWISCAALAEDFKGLRDVAAYERKAVELGRSKLVKAQLRREEEQEQKRQQAVSEVHGYLETLSDPSERQAALAFLRSSIARLRRRADAKEDSPDRRAARQVLGGLSVMASEQGRDLLARKQYLPAALRLEVAAAIRPDRPQVLYEMACAYAQAGEKNKALAALQRAVEKGFKDAARLKQDPRLEGLRGEARFEELLGKIPSQ